MKPSVEVCSPEEAARYIRALKGEPSPRPPMDYKLNGFVDLTCREDDGSVAWEVHQPNLITDLARRMWTDGNFYTGYILVSPTTEDADPSRTAFTDNGTAAGGVISVGINPGYDSITRTKTWTATPFTAPALNRQIGLIGLTRTSQTVAGYMRMLYAYTRLTPVKTQTTSQTLEVVYKITLTPLY